MSGWPARSPRRCRRSGAWGCTRRPVSPRPSTGPRPSPHWAASELDETAVERTLGSILKYREDIERISDGDLVGLVEEARRRG